MKHTRSSSETSCTKRVQTLTFRLSIVFILYIRTVIISSHSTFRLSTNRSGNHILHVVTDIVRYRFRCLSGPASETVYLAAYNPSPVSDRQTQPLSLKLDYSQCWRTRPLYSRLSLGLCVCVCRCSSGSIRRAAVPEMRDSQLMSWRWILMERSGDGETASAPKLCYTIDENDLIAV